MPTDPAAYPAAGWSRYDLLVRTAAHQLGIEGLLHLRPRRRPTGRSPRPTDHQGPIARLSAQAERVPPVRRGRRDGATAAATSTNPPARQHPATASRSSDSRCRSQTARHSRASRPSDATLPRVNYWGIWNEPNERVMAQPLVAPACTAGRCIAQPARLPRARRRGLERPAATGHAGDTILIGETANSGRSWTRCRSSARCTASAATTTADGEAPHRGRRAPPSGNARRVRRRAPGAVRGDRVRPPSVRVRHRPQPPRLPGPQFVTLADISVDSRTDAQPDLSPPTAPAADRRRAAVPDRMGLQDQSAEPVRPELAGPAGSVAQPGRVHDLARAVRPCARASSCSSTTSRGPMRREDSALYWSIIPDRA